MVRYFKYLILFPLFLTASCQEGREAGDLLGQWRMKGTDAKYISFSGTVTMFRNATEWQVFGNFQHMGDSLFIQCVSIEGSPIDTAIVENVYGFRPYANIRLKIETLNKDLLILSKESKTWNFYKY